MASKLSRKSTVQLTDWQLFTNNGNFNNPLPPGRRLKKGYPYFIREIDANSIRSRCQTARSRNQSAISSSTSRILSARSITYRRTPRVKPIDLDLNEECDEISVYPTKRLTTGRTSTASSHRPHIWDTEAWSFSCLHRAIIAIDEQAGKDYAAGRTMLAIAAWQNALVYCEQLSQRTQLWPENKATLDEEIARLKRVYKQHMEELMGKSWNTHQGNPFLIPTRKCTSCRTEQSLEQFHERFSNDCRHIERTVCNKCISNNAKSSLKTPDNVEIICPEPRCAAALNVKEVQQLITTVDNDESDENHNRQSKKKSEFIWCAQEGCGSGQFHVMDQTTSPIVTCIICKRQTCAVHRVKWHKGMTCNEYDEQQKPPPLPPPSPPTKACPKCQSSNENSGGSDHIICSKCKYDFCWECMADYKQIQRKGASHHTTTCSQYEKNPKKDASKSSACTIL